MNIGKGKLVLAPGTGLLSLTGGSLAHISPKPGLSRKYKSRAEIISFYNSPGLYHASCGLEDRQKLLDQRRRSVYCALTFRLLKR
jgi:hypothetical protein